MRVCGKITSSGVDVDYLTLEKYWVPIAALFMNTRPHTVKT